MIARLPFGAAIGAALALLPGPSAAQDAGALLGLFAQRCAAIAADPRAAANAAPDSGGVGAMTSDGAVASITETLALPDPDLLATLSFVQLATAGGAQHSCGLSIFARSGAADGLLMPEMADLLEARAAEILGGPAARAGGPVSSAGEVGQLLLWSTGEGFPPAATLALTQGAGVMLVSLVRAVPAP